jgi:hypothetical protein
VPRLVLRDIQLEEQGSVLRGVTLSGLNRDQS